MEPGIWHSAKRNVVELIRKSGLTVGEWGMQGIQPGTRGITEDTGCKEASVPALKVQYWERDCQTGS